MHSLAYILKQQTVYGSYWNPGNIA